MNTAVEYMHGAIASGIKKHINLACKHYDQVLFSISKASNDEQEAMRLQLSGAAELWTEPKWGQIGLFEIECDKTEALVLVSEIQGNGQTLTFYNPQGQSEFTPRSGVTSVYINHTHDGSTVREVATSEFKKIIDSNLVIKCEVHYQPKKIMEESFGDNCLYLVQDYGL